MIEGGWEYVWSSYAVALGGLLILAVLVVARLHVWSRRARELDRPK